MQALSTKNASGLKFHLSQFKNFIFSYGLRSAGDAEGQTRISSKIEQNIDMTQQEVAVMCQWMVNLKHDSYIVQESVPVINTFQKQ